jgi:hypothetical protein
MLNLSPSRLVLSAADALQTPTISDSRSHRHSAAKSAMSSLCPSAAAIIAKSIAVAMKLLGGIRLASIRLSALGRYG